MISNSLKFDFHFALFVKSECLLFTLCISVVFVYFLLCSLFHCTPVGTDEKRTLSVRRASGNNISFITFFSFNLLTH